VLVVAGVVALLAGRGARFIPPAPLALGAATLAEDVVQRAPVGAAHTFHAPDALWCHTAIRAPLGLRDRLFHVWLRDGAEVARIPLEVVGGVRADGFRTWSRLRRPLEGTYRCRVETAVGQVVGEVHGAVLGARAGTVDDDVERPGPAPGTTRDADADGDAPSGRDPRPSSRPFRMPDPAR
jgi:hypothetical protein